MTITDLDNSIYEHIRLALIAGQHLSDITAVSTPDAFKAANDALENSSGKKTISVYGVGGGENRGAKLINHILIDRDNESQGGLGAGTVVFVPSSQTIDANVTYSKEQLPELSTNVIYEITTVTDSMEYDDIMRNVLMTVFGRRAYKAAFDTQNNTFYTDCTFYITLFNIIDLVNGEIIERRYEFTVNDVWLEPTKVLNPAVKPIIEITDEIFAVGDGDIQEIADNTPTD